LAIWHVLFYREHNRIAKILKKINSFWPEETLFQETRKIVIAIYQHVVYNEYLPTYLSDHYIKEFKLGSLETNFENVEPVDSRTTNEFSTGIFRRFHNLVPASFNSLDESKDLLLYERKIFPIKILFLLNGKWFFASQI
jgi:peroxidase